MAKFIKNQRSEWLKAGEAARLLGLTPRCLRYWAQSGKIVAVRTPGGRYLYSVESILRMIQENCKSGKHCQSAALYARGLHYRHIREQLSTLRQAAEEWKYSIVREEYDLQGGHRIGPGFQRILLGAHRREFHVVLITCYSRLGWWGAIDPRFFHLVFSIMGVQIIPLSAFEEQANPRELLEDFQAIHEILREHLNRSARGANRKIIQALEMIRSGYPIGPEDWEV